MSINDIIIAILYAFDLMRRSRKWSQRSAKECLSDPVAISNLTCPSTQTDRASNRQNLLRKSVVRSETEKMVSRCKKRAPIESHSPSSSKIGRKKKLACKIIEPYALTCGCYLSRRTPGSVRAKDNEGELLFVLWHLTESRETK